MTGSGLPDGGPQKGKVMKIMTECPFCGERNFVCLTREQGIRYGNFLAGKGHIQDLLPDLSADDRELLLTGICPKCYASIGEEDDE